ncbi:hypothetical protein BpHYR1_017668 [Brachionus plicatilis]|uniref:Uncharacterized protein n=1 Tax=Brachionus plicatilis TaxID=10195 RepID=A0A3M7PHV9_BRAPC|nr:hypothetical protein BpHYR1_017668 [Brachionus plicatilis]
MDLVSTLRSLCSNNYNSLNFKRLAINSTIYLKKLKFSQYWKFWKFRLCKDSLHLNLISKFRSFVNVWGCE